MQFPFTRRRDIIDGFHGDTPRRSAAVMVIFPAAGETGFDLPGAHGYHSGLVKTTNPILPRPRTQRLPVQSAKRKHVMPEFSNPRRRGVDAVADHTRFAVPSGGIAAPGRSAATTPRQILVRAILRSIIAPRACIENRAAKSDSLRRNRSRARFEA